LIQVEGLRVSRNGRQILDGVSFSAAQGHVLGLLGRNGAGKTTTLKVLCGLLKADEGRVTLSGADEQSKGPPRLGCLIETPGFYPNLTAAENLLLFCRVRSRRAKADIDEAISLVGLSEARGTVGRYSLGMKQRLGIARALLGRPELVVLDEPINGLDPHGVFDVRELILDLSRREGTTFLVSSHILTEVELVADVVVVIEDGRTVATIDLGALGTREAQGADIRVDRPEAAAQGIRARWPEAVCEVLGEGQIRVVGVPGGPGVTNRFLVESGHLVTALVPLVDSLESRVMPYMKRGL